MTIITNEVSGADEITQRTEATVLGEGRYYIVRADWFAPNPRKRIEYYFETEEASDKFFEAIKVR